MNPFKSAVWVIGIVATWLVIAPLCATAQVVGGWPVGATPIVQGPTLADTVRNAAQATSDQVRITARVAVDMGGRARSGGYRMQDFSTDYQNLLVQFESLRATFHQLAQLAVQLQTARAANAVAELDAGLNIISEAFAPVQQEFQAGTLNRDTIVRMCQVLSEALKEWQKELKKDTSRLGMIR
jgi:hypothetical protein